MSSEIWPSDYLEAEKRGLWTDVESRTKDQLRAILHQAKAKIEHYSLS